jgi:hypothetical protein
MDAPEHSTNFILAKCLIERINDKYELDFCVWAVAIAENKKKMIVWVIIKLLLNKHH